jgi:hypothetical protein
MNLPKLAVDTKQFIVEGGLTNDWLARMGLEQGPESTTIDTAKLAQGGVDVAALARAAEERGHAGKITFGLLQAFPGAKVMAQIGGDQRADVQQADAAMRAGAVFNGITTSLDRATEALRAATADVQTIARDCANIQFDELLARLGPESSVMSAAKLLRAAEQQLDQLSGKAGLQTLWDSTQTQRDAIWPAALETLLAYQEAYGAFAALSQELQKKELGEAFLGARAVATVAALINESVSAIGQSAVCFRSADEVSAEAAALQKQQQAAVARDRVLRGREQFAAEYCAAKGWPADPAELSMDQIKEIRAQDGWINAGRPKPDFSSPEAAAKTMYAIAEIGDWNGFVGAHHPDFRGALEQYANTDQIRQVILGSFVDNDGTDLGARVNATKDEQVYERDGLRSTFKLHEGQWMLAGAEMTA